MTGRSFIREKVLAEARSWIGTSYRHQGDRKGVGCDCLGLVRGVWEAVYGTPAPRPVPYSADWAEAGPSDALIDAARRWFREKPAMAEIVPGNLLVFRWQPNARSKHLGIASGGQHFIHAYSGNGVIESALVPQWRRRISGVFAFPETL